MTTNSGWTVARNEWRVKGTERPLSALDAIYGRRSVRSYTPQKLEKSTVRALLDAAVQAPTAMLEQPWVYVVVQDRQLLRRLSDHVKATWARETVPADELRLARGSTLHAEFIERLEDPAFNVFHDAGTLVVICARRTDPFAVADCWRAAENLMLAACALGLGTCCIGAAVGALNAPEMKAALGVPADVHAVAPIVVRSACRQRRASVAGRARDRLLERAAGVKGWPKRP